MPSAERRDVEENERGASERSTTPPMTPLGEHLREVEEHRRQRQHRDGVGPVEDPVEPIQPPAEREGEDAEERDRQPEEMQRCGIARTPQSDGASDQQGEDTDRREHEIQRARTVGHRRQPEIQDLARAETKDGVAKRPLIAAGVVQDVDDISRALNRVVVDREQQVAARQANAIRRTSLRHFLDDSTVGARRPQHAVFDFLPRRARRDVRDAKAEQSRHDDDWQSRS